MTKEEYANLKVGDELFFKGVNEICKVLDTNWSDFNDTFHLIEWRGLTIMLDENNLDPFEVVKKQIFRVPIEVTSIIYYDVEAENIDDALEKADTFVDITRDDELLSMSGVSKVMFLTDEIRKKE